MKVLVTGAAGYIGSVVARLLLSEGHEVCGVDSLMHGGHALLGLFAEESFSFIKSDIRDAARMRQAVTGFDAVVHLAAIVGDPSCNQQPESARSINLDASLQLLEISRMVGVQRFIFASTCSNYGRTADPSVYLNEDAELRPVSVYAQTKVSVEKVLLEIPKNDRPTACVLRLATVFGVSPRMRFDLTVNQFTMELLTTGRLQVFGEQFWRPYVHVRDVARAISLVLRAPIDKVKGRVYNVGDSTQNYQKRALAELILANVGEKGRIQYVRRGEEDGRDYKVAFERISDELGFRISRTVIDGVREVSQIIRDGIITDVAKSAVAAGRDR